MRRVDGRAARRHVDRRVADLGEGPDGLPADERGDGLLLGRRGGRGGAGGGRGGHQRGRGDDHVLDRLDEFDQFLGPGAVVPLAGGLDVDVVGRQEVLGGLEGVVADAEREARVLDQRGDGRVVGRGPGPGGGGQHPGGVDPRDHVVALVRRALLDHLLEGGVEGGGELADVVGLVGADLVAGLGDEEARRHVLGDDGVGGRQGVADVRVELGAGLVGERAGDQVGDVAGVGGEGVLGRLHLVRGDGQAGPPQLLDLAVGGGPFGEFVLGRLAGGRGRGGQREPGRSEERPAEGAGERHGDPRVG